VVRLFEEAPSPAAPAISVPLSSPAKEKTPEPATKELPEAESEKTSPEKGIWEAVEKAPEKDAVVSPAEEGLPLPPRLPSPSVEGRPERIFDEEVIEGLARRKEQETQQEGGGVTFDTREMMYRSYMERLREKIEGIWSYPDEAARSGIYGDLVIRFVIRKDGSLGSVRVLRTSGHSMLDEAALKALRDAEPYWPLPAGWDRSSLTVTGHFIYNLYGVRIR